MQLLCPQYPSALERPRALARVVAALSEVAMVVLDWRAHLPRLRLLAQRLAAVTIGRVLWLL